MTTTDKHKEPAVKWLVEGGTEQIDSVRSLDPSVTFKIKETFILFIIILYVLGL